MIGTALGIGLGIASAAGSLGGAAISSHAAGKAAKTQATAATAAADAQAAATKYAADLQANASAEALAFSKKAYEDAVARLQPFLTTGTAANAQIGQLMGLGDDRVRAKAEGDAAAAYDEAIKAGKTPAEADAIAHGVLDPALAADQYGTLAQTWDKEFAPPPAFKAPTAEEARATPGYQFQLQEGAKALERAAASRGTLLTGGTAKAMTRYAQDYADTKYGATYNRALAENELTYGRASDEYKLAQNTFRQNQADRFNKLAAVSGTGLVTAENLSALGTNTARDVSGLLTGTASRIGDITTRGTQAENEMRRDAAGNMASGYLRSADAWSAGVGGAAKAYTGAMTLTQMMDWQAQQNALRYNPYNPATKGLT